MSSERLVAAFDDIVRAVDLIDAWVREAGGAANALRADTQSRSAIERQLLIVSEAAIRLHRIDPEAAARLAPSVDWPGVRGAGNFIRHKYDDLDEAIIVGVVGERLGALRESCMRAIDAPQGGEMTVRSIRRASPSASKSAFAPLSCGTPTPARCIQGNCAVLMSRF